MNDQKPFAVVVCRVQSATETEKQNDGFGELAVTWESRSKHHETKISTTPAQECRGPVSVVRFSHEANALQQDQMCSRMLLQLVKDTKFSHAV